MKYLFFITLFFLLQGCDEKEKIYSRFLTKEQPVVTCVDFNRSSSYAIFIEKEAKDVGLSCRRGCVYQIKVFKNFATCTSQDPDASRGFMRLELMKKGQPLYQVQQEFRNEDDENLIANLIKKMSKELTPFSP